MKRLNKKELELISKLIEMGYSLNKISTKLNKSKTTIYYHYRKTKGETMHPIKNISFNEELLGEFIGLFAGDGYSDKTSDYKYRTYLFFNLLKEEDFVKDLTKNVLIPLFNKSPMISKRKNLLTLSYYSKEIHKLIKSYLEWDPKIKKTYSVGLKKKKFSRKFKIGFIRGSLDSDGYFSQKKISFATVSPKLAEDISSLLKDLEIKHSKTLYKEKRKNRKDIYHIFVSWKDHKKFIDLINPRNRASYNARTGI